MEGFETPSELESSPIESTFKVGHVPGGGLITSLAHIDHDDDDLTLDPSIQTSDVPPSSNFTEEQLLKWVDVVPLSPMYDPSLQVSAACNLPMSSHTHFQIDMGANVPQSGTLASEPSTPSIFALTSSIDDAANSALTTKKQSADSEVHAVAKSLSDYPPSKLP